MLRVLGSTGILLEYLLPLGSGGLGQSTEGRGASRPVTVLWGLSRHEWGAIHFWIALALLAILALHLFLHWRWIYGVVRGRQTNASGTRLVIGAVALLALIALAGAPLLGRKSLVPRSSLMDSTDRSNANHMADRESAVIRGSMMLAEPDGVLADRFPVDCRRRSQAIASCQFR